MSFPEGILTTYDDELDLSLVTSDVSKPHTSKIPQKEFTIDTIKNETTLPMDCLKRICQRRNMEKKKKILEQQVKLGGKSGEEAEKDLIDLLKHNEKKKDYEENEEKEENDPSIIELKPFKGFKFDEEKSESTKILNMDDDKLKKNLNFDENMGDIITKSEIESLKKEREELYKAVKNL